MKKTIGWAAVGQDGEIVAGNSPLTFDHFFIYRTSSPGLVRVKIIAYPEKKAEGLEEEMSDDTKNVDDGGPAFPTDSECQIGPHRYHFPGMTLRDYFAGMALQGLSGNSSVDMYPVDLAALSCGIADAMIESRKK